MAVTTPILDQTYRYPFPSAVVGDGEARRLRLATSGGPSPNPQFFRGRVIRPVVAADLLLVLGDVARSRFHVPAQMLARILQAADPVATCTDDRLRFEAFSACGSVYGRADFLPDGFDGESIGRGTTNVDFGPNLRAALAKVQDRTRLGLSVGEAAIEVAADGTVAVERRVPLPSRWLRGFLEVGAIQGELQPAAEVDGAAGRRFLRSLPKAPPRSQVWIATSTGGLRLAHHDPGRGAIAVGGIARLRLLERILRHAKVLRIYASEDERSTAWSIDVPGARLTLVLSPEVWRGFSGEGRALERLASTATPATLAGVRAELGWRPRMTVDDIAAATGRSTDVVAAALSTLALSGLVGYDLVEGGYFRRELPFDLERVERLQPRLREARRLVERGVAHLEQAATDAIEGWVAGAGGVEYRVRLTASGSACTCAWFGRHRGDRGPCKHVLAIQLLAADVPA